MHLLTPTDIICKMSSHGLPLISLKCFDKINVLSLFLLSVCQVILHINSDFLLLDMGNDCDTEPLRLAPVAALRPPASTSAFTDLPDPHLSPCNCPVYEFANKIILDTAPYTSTSQLA